MTVKMPPVGLHRLHGLVDCDGVLRNGRILQREKEQSHGLDQKKCEKNCGKGIFFHGLPPVNLYPSPQTVRMYCGLPGVGSIASRSFRICTFRVPSPVNLSSQIFSKSSCLETTLFSFRTR